MALKTFNKLTRLPQWELPPPKRLKWTQKHIKYAWWDIYSFQHCHKYSLSSSPGIPQPEAHSCFFQKATSPPWPQSSRPTWNGGIVDSVRDTERSPPKFPLGATAVARRWQRPLRFFQWRSRCLWKSHRCRAHLNSETLETAGRPQRSTHKYEEHPFLLLLNLESLSLISTS